MSSDLINLTPLVLTDTFNTWLNRTNQIIYALNPLQVYEINVVGGLLKQTGMSAGNYNGVVSLSVNPGPGINYRTYADGVSRTIVDFSYFEPFGLNATAGLSGFHVLPNDEFLFNVIDDTSGGPSAAGNPASSGTVKKVKARNILPPVLDIPPYGINLNGNVTIAGNLVVEGNDTFVAANNLRVQDKLFEIAYQESVPLTITGATSGSFVPGTTAYHFITPTGLTPGIEGWVQSYTGPAAGPTGRLVIGYPFAEGNNAQDFAGLTGYVSLSPTGSYRFAVSSIGSVFNSFLDDINLSPAGLVVKGSSGDKEWIWRSLDDDTGSLLNSWMSNTSIGVNNANGSVISRVYRSFGFTGVDKNEFIFTSENTKNTDIYITQLLNNTSPYSFTGGWRISRVSNNNLQFDYGVTGIAGLTTSFIITVGPSGNTYSGIPITNYAKFLNADLLDGVHAGTTATPFTIPISDSSGRIEDSWFSVSSLRKKFSVTGHGFTNGDVLRYNSSGVFAKAIATNPEYAEAVGIVSEVNSANEFTLTYKGRITGLSGAAMTEEGVPLQPGGVYFLSKNTAGKLMADPDYASATKLVAGEIRKPMLLAASQTEGIVLNYIGTKLPTVTDEVYLDGLVPIGTIYPFAGSTDYVGPEWLLCDGDVYRAIDYPALYTVIGRTYTAQVTFNTTGVTATVIGGIRNLTAGTTVTIGGLTRTISSVNAGAGTITVSSSVSAGTYTLNVSTNSSGENLFFVPDLRTRFPMGGSTGDTQYTSIVGLSGHTIGSIGGNAAITLSNSQLPSHAHGLGSTNVQSGSSSVPVITGAGTNTTTGATGNSDPIDISPRYLVVNYIIRAKANTAATVLTGHNHDLRYIRYDALHGSGLTGGLTLSGRNTFKTNARVSGIALGSITSGDYHDHDSRYVRFDMTGGPALDLTGHYIARQNIRASAFGEGDSYILDNAAGQTQHNHDSIYVRFDNKTQSLFTESSRNYFVNTKIGALNLSGGSMNGGITFNTSNSFITFNNSNAQLKFVSNGQINFNDVESSINFATNGILNFSDNRGIITGLTSPTQPNNAANKFYVDREIQNNRSITGSLDYGNIDAIALGNTASTSTSTMRESGVQTYTINGLRSGIYLVNVTTWFVGTESSDKNRMPFITINGTRYYFKLSDTDLSDPGTSHVPISVIISVTNSITVDCDMTSVGFDSEDSRLSNISYARIGS